MRSNKWAKLLDVIFKPVEFNILPDQVLALSYTVICCIPTYTNVIEMVKLMTASLKIWHKKWHKKKMIKCWYLISAKEYAETNRDGNSLLKKDNHCLISYRLPFFFFFFFISNFVENFFFFIKMCRLWLIK